uniref:Uncharacterized protein n=1 Tax=Arundo donax TaxID=35708 RepID=A0A0A8Y206_ARUDO
MEPSSPRAPASPCCVPASSPGL